MTVTPSFAGRKSQPLPALLVGLLLLAGGCGGGGAKTATATPSTSSDTAVVTVGSNDPPATDTGTPTTSGSPAVTPAPVAPADTPAAPALPRASLVADDLAVLVAEGDPLSEAIGRAYQLARGISDDRVIRLPVAVGSDSITEREFASLKAQLDARLPATVQATLVTWRQPSRVQGASCAMGLTSALAFGYNAAMCGGCDRTQASAYYDTDTTRPWTDLHIRPSMMLGASSLEEAQALIQRGLAAEASHPTGNGWLIRTTDTARSVRWPDFAILPAAWVIAPATSIRYLDASLTGTAQELVGQHDLMFYFTGAAKLPQLASNRFLPGAVGDHLTSFGGFLPDAMGQMPATAWLAAGATASYGTVEEPCNHLEKFPRASVLVDHYQRGATVLEAYWKSVAWPGQGLFVGDPLARPWAQQAYSAIEGNALVIGTRSLRRGAAYRVDWQAANSSLWRVLDSQLAGQPRDFNWRMPLPAGSAGGKLRWIGPCPLQPSQSCVLGGG